MHAFLAVAIAFWIPQDPEPALFEDPLPVKAAKNRDVPDSARAVQALEALSRFDRAGVGAELDRFEDPDLARKIVASADALDGLLHDYATLVAAAPGRIGLIVPDPKKPKRLLAYKVRSFHERTRSFVLGRGKLSRTVPIWRVPPHLFAESAAKKKLLNTTERKSALGLLLAIHRSSLGKSSRRRADKRAGKLGIRADRELVPRFEAGVLAALALRNAESEIRGGKEPAPILEALARRLRSLPDRPEVRHVVRSRAEALISLAFLEDPTWISVLRGKGQVLPCGVIRVVYDWSDAAQAEDWLPVPRGPGGLEFEPHSRGGSGKFEVDTEEKILRFRHVGYHRYLIQFQGDVRVSWQRYVTVKKTGNETLTRSYPGPIFVICGQRPNTYISSEPLIDGAGLSACLAGNKWYRELDEGKEEDPFELMETTVISLLRRGGTARLEYDGNEASRISVKRIPPRGAVMMLQDYSPTMKFRGRKKPRTELVAVRKVTLEGRPHPAGSAVARARYLARWRKVFPDSAFQ